MNYKQLKSQIRATLSVNDPIINAYIPSFIQQAQERLSRECQIVELLKIETFNVPIDGVVNKPDNMNRPISASYVYDNTTIQLEWRDRTMMQLYASGGGEGDGSTPFYWGWDRRGNNQVLRFAPSPSGVLDILVTYTQKFPALANDTDTNDLMTYVPTLFLYASLLEAAPFMNEDPRIAVWESLYKTADDSVTQNNQLQKSDLTSSLEII